jgi:hypothetical protein
VLKEASPLLLYVLGQRNLVRRQNAALNELTLYQKICVEAGGLQFLELIKRKLTYAPDDPVS